MKETFKWKIYVCVWIVIISYGKYCNHMFAVVLKNKNPPLHILMLWKSLVWNVSNFFHVFPCFDIELYDFLSRLVARSSRVVFIDNDNNSAVTHACYDSDIACHISSQPNPFHYPRTQTDSTKSTIASVSTCLLSSACAVQIDKFDGRCKAKENQWENIRNKH